MIILFDFLCIIHKQKLNNMFDNYNYNNVCPSFISLSLLASSKELSFHVVDGLIHFILFVDCVGVIEVQL